MGSSVTTRCKNWERITILGAFGVISEIQRAKFGVSVTYIFGGKIWGSHMNFRGKIWGQAPPNLLLWKYPLWVPNFIQTVEIEAILESKRILVYTLLINKSGNGVIYKTSIFCRFNICPFTRHPYRIPLHSSLSYGMGVFMSSNFLRPPSNQLSFLCRLYGKRQ